MITEDSVDEARLAEFQIHLAALRYDGVGRVEAMVLSPEMDCHQFVSALRVIPETGVEGQYPGKQWWRGTRVAGRQVSAINAEVLDVLGIPYDIPGDNLIIRGIDLSQFKPGDVLRVGDALMIVTPTTHRPCAKLARRTTLTKKTALSYGKLRGIMLDAREAAMIQMGDAAERLLMDGV